MESASEVRKKGLQYDWARYLRRVGPGKYLVPHVDAAAQREIAASAFLDGRVNPPVGVSPEVNLWAGISHPAEAVGVIHTHLHIRVGAMARNSQLQRRP